MHQPARDVFGEYSKIKRIIALFSSATILGLCTHQYVIYIFQHHHPEQYR
jgi:hypothetical protein